MCGAVKMIIENNLNNHMDPKMLIIEYLSKSYLRFLEDMDRQASLKSRFLITFNGASAEQLTAISDDITSSANKLLLYSTLIEDEVSANEVADVFCALRNSGDMLLLDKADPFFEDKTAVKNRYDSGAKFDLNHLLKNISKHKGMVILATEKSQTVSASMSSKIDVLIRFPNSKVDS